MTDRIEREASELLDRIDALGGTLAAIEAGFIQQQIQDAAYRAQQAIDRGDAVVVGVNRFADDAARPRPSVFRIDPDIERRQIERVRAVRASRSERDWRAALDAVERGRARRRQSRAADHRRRRSARDARRDCRRDARRLRRVPGRIARDAASATRCRRSPEPLLDVQHLTVTFGGPSPAVDDVSFQIAPGETLGLVGESGSGKSVTAFSILRLLQPPGRITGGRVMFEGRDLLTLPEREMREVRGARISLIFQEPMTALNPVMRVGDQIAEALLVHGKATRAEARARAVELLDAVRIPDAARRVRDYPHQLSGGMRQRVMIAIALACRPPLVIADEPTTALDVTIQAQVLDLLRELKARYNLALLLITHDFGVIAEMADRVAVMYEGRLVEAGPGARRSCAHPSHEYTRSLLAAVPGMRPAFGSAETR